MQDWFDGGRSFNFWSFVVGVVGLFLGLYGLYVAFKSKREKKPLFHADSYEVVSRNHAVDGLQISVHGVAVSSLTVTRISYWNAGRETIHRSDIVWADPIKISPLDSRAEILGAKLVAVARGVNDVQIEPSAKGVVITFDFLDQGDGCTIDIYHSVPSNFSITGTLKGAPPATD